MSLHASFNKRDSGPKTAGTTPYDSDGRGRNVCFVPSNGSQLFLNYAHLISGALSLDAKEITLNFTTHTVTLKGQKLKPLFDALEAQRIRRIATVEVEERYAPIEEAESFVTEIVVQSN